MAPPERAPAWSGDGPSWRWQRPRTQSHGQDRRALPAKQRRAERCSKRERWPDQDVPAEGLRRCSHVVGQNLGLDKAVSRNDRRAARSHHEQAGRMKRAVAESWALLVTQTSTEVCTWSWPSRDFALADPPSYLSLPCFICSAILFYSPPPHFHHSPTHSLWHILRHRYPRKQLYQLLDTMHVRHDGHRWVYQTSSQAGAFFSTLNNALHQIRPKSYFDGKHFTRTTSYRLLLNEHWQYCA